MSWRHTSDQSNFWTRRAGCRCEYLARLRRLQTDRYHHLHRLQGV